MPPTNDAWVQIPAVIIGLSLLLVLSLALRGFSLGIPVFLSPQNQYFQIPIRPGMLDEEPLCGCAASKSRSLFNDGVLKAPG